VSELDVISPTCIVWHPNGARAYAACEFDPGRIQAIDVSPAGALAGAEGLRTGGAGPCHVALSVDAAYLFSADYQGGTVSAFSLDTSGRLEAMTDVVVHEGSGPVIGRQGSAHPHMVVCRPDGHIYVVDLGTDEVRRYVSGARGQLQLTSIDPMPAGCGPRQLAFSPGGDSAYLLGELTSELFRLVVRSDGSLRVRSSTRVTGSPMADGASHLFLSPSGRRAYVSNRGPGTIAVLDLSCEPAVLIEEISCGGTSPRQFAFIDDRLWIGNQQSDSVRSYRVRTDVQEQHIATQEYVDTPIRTPTWLAPGRRRPKESWEPSVTSAPLGNQGR
jgi:6-phosphogluconolactonase (cycloisomerase 2 family)